MKHNRTNTTNIAATLTAALIVIFALLITPPAARAQTQDFVPADGVSSNGILDLWGDNGVAIEEQDAYLLSEYADSFITATAANEPGLDRLL